MCVLEKAELTGNSFKIEDYIIGLTRLVLAPLIQQMRRSHIYKYYLYYLSAISLTWQLVNILKRSHTQKLFCRAVVLNL